MLQHGMQQYYSCSGDGVGGERDVHLQPHAVFPCLSIHVGHVKVLCCLLLVPPPLCRVSLLNPVTLGPGRPAISALPAWRGGWRCPTCLHHVTRIVGLTFVSAAGMWLCRSSIIMLEGQQQQEQHQQHALDLRGSSSAYWRYQ